MKSHRIIIYSSAILAVSAVLPGYALASPLLSGYGGPGQGNQALLGSTLINGPKGGGGSSGSGASTGTAIAESAETSSEGQASNGGGGGGAGSGKGGGTGSSSAGAPSSRHGATATAHGEASTPAAAPSFYPTAERLPADSQGGSLGLSGTDVLFIVLAAALLVSLGLLTRRASDSAERESTGG